MAITAKSILPTHTDKLDINGDGFTDLVWQGADGTLAVWNMFQDGMTGQAGLFQPARRDGYTLRGASDVQGDGTTDLIWQNADGRVEVWSIRDNQVASKTPGPPTQQIQATGDFDGNGRADLLWQDSDGAWWTSTTETRKVPPTGLGKIAPPVDADFKLVGVGDFDGDGRDGIMFRGTGNDTGTFLIQEPVTVAPRAGQVPVKPITFADPGADWSVLGLADFDGDKKTDILWQHTNQAGEVDARAMWLMGGGGGIVVDPGTDWRVSALGDYNNDGKTDLMWRHDDLGWNIEMLMDGVNMKGFGWGFVVSGDFWTLGAV